MDETNVSRGAVRNGAVSAFGGEPPRVIRHVTVYSGQGATAAGRRTTEPGGPQSGSDKPHIGTFAGAGWESLPDEWPTIRPKLLDRQ